MNKKVLILTMTCGEGHNAIAKSIANELTKNNTDCKIVDVFESKPKLKKFYNDSYLFLCKHFPKTYQFFWQKQRGRRNKPRSGRQSRCRMLRW